jgi:hypothetical protein
MPLEEKLIWLKLGTFRLMTYITKTYLVFQKMNADGWPPQKCYVKGTSKNLPLPEPAPANATITA